MGTDFEKKKNSNLCGDTADITPPPPYLGQDFMQSPVIDIRAHPKSCIGCQNFEKKSANAEKSAKSPSLGISHTLFYKQFLTFAFLPLPPPPPPPNAHPTVPQ